VWQLQLREEARRKAEAGTSASPTTAVRTKAHRSLARAEHWARAALGGFLCDSHGRLLFADGSASGGILGIDGSAGGGRGHGRCSV
jgi:hypothetical protein